MKFLCDNCKAKYQIADEKVAGKTVRMKCRKCGHQIEVRAAVTETSVSTSPPKAPEAPRPGVAPRSSLATSLSAQKPRAPMGAQPGPGSGSALAGAFQKTVQESPQSVPPPGAGPVDVSVTDEWYVAINGVPVGPVRISELRRKAAAGAVTEDSLCWQEGLEEWRPVRSVPELAAIVREAAQGNRPSLTAPPPAEQRTSSPPRPPARPAPQAPRASEPPGGTGTRPLAAPLAPARSNVVPLRPAASSHDDMAGSPFGGGAAAALAPQFSAQPAPSPFGSQPALAPTPAPAPVAIADPFAVPPAPLTASASASSASIAAAPAPFSPSLAPQQPRRAGVPLWFWLVALFTVSFGGVAAYAMFFRQQPQQAPVVIQMPATNAPAATTAAPDVPPPTATPEPTTSAAPTATAGAKVATGGPKAAAAPAATEKKTTDLSGLLGGTGGPGVGGPSGPGASGGGGLDQSSVERVVASHRTGVKRTCWERGGADQKSSVNVTVTATVGPDGSVTNTSSSGDDPVVGKCIENQVRSWRFNAPGSSTTIHIPFKFVRQ